MYAFSFGLEGIRATDASVLSEEEGSRKERGGGRDEVSLTSSVGSPLIGLIRVGGLGLLGGHLLGPMGQLREERVGGACFAGRGGRYGFAAKDSWSMRITLTSWIPSGRSEA